MQQNPAGRCLAGGSLAGLLVQRRRPLQVTRQAVSLGQPGLQPGLPSRGTAVLRQVQRGPQRLEPCSRHPGRRPSSHSRRTLFDFLA